MRRKAADDSQNLDSLLDTMANVVGILVVILAVTQLGVGEAMKRIQRHDDLAASERKLAEGASAERRAELAELEARWAELAPERAALELAALREDLSRLRRMPNAERLRELSPAALAASLASAKTTASQLEGSVANASAELAKLRIGLANMPIIEDLRVLRLPDPRPARRGSRSALFFCRYGRTFRVDFDRLEAQLIAQLESTPPGADFPDVGNAELRWRPLAPTDGRSAAQLLWRDHGAGETSAEILRPDSKFRKALAELDPTERVARFHVWPDSYEVYLLARELAEDRDLYVGWQEFDLEEESEWWLTQEARDPALLID